MALLETLFENCSGTSLDCAVTIAVVAWKDEDDVVEYVFSKIDSNYKFADVREFVYS
jgi:hypothetical protein